MQVQFGRCVLQLTQGDITAANVDAIVNAANADLAGGGGVDGAIHSAAGPSVMDETRRCYPDGCPTGSAVATGAGDLPVSNIFHAVGPIWSGGRSGEPELLSGAYVASLRLALEHQAGSVAFPAISTGVYGYPIDLAAELSLRTVRDFLVEHRAPESVVFFLFGAGAYGAYARALDDLVAESA